MRSLIFGFLAVALFSSPALCQTPRTLVKVGRSLLNPTTEELLKTAQWIEATENNEELRNGLLNAALIYAASTGDKNQVADVVKELPDDAELLSHQVVLSSLSSGEVVVDPAVLSSDQVALILESRAELILAAMIGNPARLDDSSNRITHDGDIPLEIRDALTELSQQCKRVAELTPASPLKVAVDAANAASTKDQLAVAEAYQKFARYLAADPEERQFFAATRGGGTNQFDVFKSVAENRAETISALSKVRTEYWNGELKRGEAIAKMQEITGTSLDLKEKRLKLYWALRDMRNQRSKEAASEGRVKRTLAKEKRLQRTSADISVNWPGILDHKNLRDAANSLRKELSLYSISNSGPLSICCAKCCQHISTLSQALRSELDGISASQRSLLRAYLRELNEELLEPFSPEGNLNYLAVQFQSEAPLSNRTAIATVSPQETNKLISLNLSGGRREWASYSLTQSLVRSLLVAGQSSNPTELTSLAKVIRESDLLTKKHRIALNKIGTKIYKGEYKPEELRQMDDPISVLAQIAGVEGPAQLTQSDSDAYQDEAFEILLAEMIRKPNDS